MLALAVAVAFAASVALALALALAEYTSQKTRERERKARARAISGHAQRRPREIAPPSWTTGPKLPTWRAWHEGLTGATKLTKRGAQLPSLPF